MKKVLIGIGVAALLVGTVISMGVLSGEKDTKKAASSVSSSMEVSTSSKDSTGTTSNIATTPETQETQETTSQEISQEDSDLFPITNANWNTVRIAEGSGIPYRITKDLGTDVVGKRMYEITSVEGNHKGTLWVTEENNTAIGWDDPALEKPQPETQESTLSSSEEAAQRREIERQEYKVLADILQYGKDREDIGDQLESNAFQSPIPEVMRSTLAKWSISYEVSDREWEDHRAKDLDFARTQANME